MGKRYIPPELRAQAAAARTEYNKPEAKASRAVSKVASVEKESRTQGFAKQAGAPTYATKELMQQSEPAVSGQDVDEKVASRRQLGTQAVTGDLAHFDLGDNLHNSLSHATESLFGKGGYQRATKADPKDKVYNTASNLLHQARLHLDAHYDAHMDGDAAKSLAHLNKFSGHMSSALAAYRSHPNASDTLGTSGARAQASKFDTEAAQRVVEHLPKMYADHVNKFAGISLGKPRTATVEDVYAGGPKGKQPQVSPIFFGTKRAKVPKKRNKAIETPQATPQELEAKRKAGEEVGEEWVKSVEEKKNALKGVSDYKERERTKRGLDIQRQAGAQHGFEETPKSEQPQTRETPTWREKSAPTALDKEHDTNVQAYRTETANHHAMMAIIKGANGEDHSHHMGQLSVSRQNKVSELITRTKNAANKNQIMGTLMVQAGQHKAAADEWYAKAQKTQKQLMEED